MLTSDFVCYDSSVESNIYKQYTTTNGEKNVPFSSIDSGSCFIACITSSSDGSWSCSPFNQEGYWKSEFSKIDVADSRFHLSGPTLVKVEDRCHYFRRTPFIAAYTNCKYSDLFCIKEVM
jgi:hypothetical protein